MIFSITWKWRWDNYFSIKVCFYRFFWIKLIKNKLADNLMKIFSTLKIATNFNSLIVSMHARKIIWIKDNRIKTIAINTQLTSKMTISKASTNRRSYSWSWMYRSCDRFDMLKEFGVSWWDCGSKSKNKLDFNACRLD